MLTERIILVPFFAIIILNLPLAGLMNRLAFGLALVLSLLQVFLALFTQANIFGVSFSTFDSLTRVMLLCIGIVLFTTLSISRRFFSDRNERFNFINLLLVALAGMNGVVCARDIFSLYVFLEIAAAASFILIVFNKDIFAFEGAFKYLMLSGIASIFLIFSIAFLLILSGSTEFSAISAALKNSAHNPLALSAIGLFLTGAFIKAGLMPFHGWLPDAYSSAPNPVTVLLAGIVTKTVGVYALIRVVISVFGFSPSLNNILLLIGIVSVVLGAIAALGQSDFKRMLAYSSISQIGYIILGLGCATPLGIIGAVFHIFNHAIFKSLLFLNQAAVESQTGTRDMDKLSGLAVKMPVAGLTSVVGVLSCAGVPPLAGFWSKLIIIIALWITGQYVYAIIAILASVLTLAYLLSMQRRVFFGKLGEEFINIKEAGFGAVFSAVALALITVGVGLAFPLLFNNFILPIGNIFGG